MPKAEVAKSDVDWSRIRAQFPGVVDRVYLNTATFGQLPLAAQAAMSEFFRRQERMASQDLLAWFAALDRIRGRAAQLVNATAEDIAFFPSTAHALAELLHGIAWQEGDEILALENEFPNNIYAPAALAARGVRLREVAREDLLAAVGPNVKLIVASVMNYADGYRFPWRLVEARRKEVGALLYLDGTQGAGALALDVEAMQPDMLAVHGYKWLLSPAGAGFAYISPALRKWLPPQVVGWRSHYGWREVDNLHHGPPVYGSSAQRYEGVMQPLALLMAMEQSLELMLGLGVATIEQRVQELAAMAARLVGDLGGEVAEHGSPIVACRFPGKEAGELSRALEQQGIFTSARHGRLRISVQFYNNEADFERLGAALAQLVK
ncbi:MAG: aminotransferase class V-fold PLP-dependent enzyme [Bryobacter sp.]|nr:aminotransferase class V-fold PLP-dependent enzyme [Bryobacter sp.]